MGHKTGETHRPRRLGASQLFPRITWLAPPCIADTGLHSEAVEGSRCVLRSGLRCKSSECFKNRHQTKFTRDLTAQMEQHGKAGYSDFRRRSHLAMWTSARENLLCRIMTCYVLNTEWPHPRIMNESKQAGCSVTLSLFTTKRTHSFHT